MALVLGSTTRLGSYHMRHVNYVVVECSDVNVAPLFFGPLAALAGLGVVWRRRNQGRFSQSHLILGTVCVALGLLQLLGGLDLLGGFKLSTHRDRCDSPIADVEPRMSPLPPPLQAPASTPVTVDDTCS